MDKGPVVAALEEVAVLLEIKGENPFKCRAYSNAARSLETDPRSLKELVDTGELGSLKGIGKAIEEKITGMFKTGEFPLLEELRAEIPAGLLDLVKIPGLGPKKAKAIYDELGITTPGELEYVCRENRLVALPGFGEKTQAKILEKLEYMKKHAGLFRINVAHETAQMLVEKLRKRPGIKRLEVAGSLRRCKEIVQDIDLLAVASKAEEVMDFFVHLSDVESVTAHGPTKSSIVLKNGMAADLRVVEPASFAAALMYFTGSKEHNTRIRGRAKAQDLKLNEYGLFPADSDRAILCKDEEAIYRKLGLAYIPPELREDQGEVEAAEKGDLPELVQRSQIRGFIHVHSTWSDGVLSIEDWARKASAQGYEYLGICDHSKSAAYAGGLNSQSVKDQQAEIREVQKKFPRLRILSGTEADILGDGELDFDDKTLASFDFVIASIHSRFKLSRDEQTRRVLRAMENPHVTMLGHPTGRLLLAREGYDLDMEAVLKHAARHRVAVETNAHPYRLDLDWRWGRLARELGLFTSINPDAHDTDGFEHVDFGVGIVRKAGFDAERVLNTFPCDDFVKWKKSGR
ncbi:MAG: DNA polymerase/3'-5' exonuclease PolX [bacterium]